MLRIRFSRDASCVCVFVCEGKEREGRGVRGEMNLIRRCQRKKIVNKVTDIKQCKMKLRSVHLSDSLSDSLSICPTLCPSVRAPSLCLTFLAHSRADLNTPRKESREISYMELIVASPASAKYRIEPGERERRRTGIVIGMEERKKRECGQGRE